LIKDQVHCFSMQVVINKCYLLNPKKNLAQIRLVVFKKNDKEWLICKFEMKLVDIKKCCLNE